MKKTILLITGLLLLFSVEGQILRYSNATVPVVPPAGGTTDDFEAYSAGTLAGQGNWVALMRTMTVADISGNNVVSSNAIFNYAAAMIDGTFSDDQYAEVELISVTGWMGPIVRGNDAGNSTANYYFYSINGSGNRALIKFIDGIESTLGEAGAITNSIGDVLRLEVEGTTIRCYRNGNLDTALTGGTGTFTDSDISSGAPGIGGQGNAGTNHGDNFECGDL